MNDELQQVQTYIHQGNPLAFINAYLSLAEQGYNVPIPSSLEINGIKEGWNQIITQSLQAACSEDFTEDVAQIWLTAIKKQGGKVTDNFAREMLDIINNRAVPKTSSPEKQPSSSPKQPHRPATEQSPAPEISSAVPVLDSVSSIISEDYRTVQELARQQAVPIDELKKRMKRALDIHDPDLFLHSHLNLVKHNILPELPIELSHNGVKNSWERILTFEYGAECPDHFLNTLSDLWVNMVHCSGPVTTMDSVMRILEQYEIKRKKNTKPQPQTKQHQKPKKPGALAQILKFLGLK